MRGETVLGSKPAVPGPMSLRRASALVTEQQARMALGEQAANDGPSVPPERLQTEEDTQEHAAVDDEDEFSLSLLPPASARDRRRRERGNKSKCKDMSEEEMMDLALRLSEREATVTASRLKQEEEAVMKAIKESMVNQTQTVLSSQSQSPPADEHADVSSQVRSRRKLLFSNGKMTSASDQGDDCPTETGVKATGEENNNRNKKRKRERRGSLPEVPDLMQTRDVDSQASPCSSESVSVPLDSPQSFDSTQRDDSRLRKSPVFPLTGCRATVCMSRLSQDLLETCKVSGFVSCSQDSWIQKSLDEAKSPTFPKSPMNFPAGPNSPVCTDIDEGEQMSPECGGSPVFGSTTRQDRSPSACKPQVCKNSGFTFSSQESFSSSGRSASCRSDSPLFPGSLPAVETPAISKNPVFSGTEARRAEQSPGCSTRPAYGRTGRRQAADPSVTNSSVVPSSAELRGSNGGEPSQSLEVDTCKTDPSWDGGFKKLSQSATADAQDSEASDGCGSAEEELASDMTLLWSDEDDGTPAGSPSPVFPEERPVHRAAADPETTGSNCSRWGTIKRASGPCEEPAAVHYYWGVPFCPRGLDPDRYTQVILAQMEVYEKSLKQAQRCLLRKAEWGQPVLPRPEDYHSPESPAESPPPQIPQRHGLRLGRKKRHESAEDDDDADCELCPETQLSDVSDDRAAVPAVPDDAQARPGSAELPEAQRILPGDSPAAGVQEEEMEADGTAAGSADAAGNVSSAPDPGETDGSWSPAHLKAERLDPDVEEGTEQRLQRSGSPAVEAPAAHMDCPICQGSFPVTEIEVHAAYCDGELDEQRTQVPSLPNASKPHRKRARRAEAPDDDVRGRNQEKCYICQRAVPLRDYSRHTELCLQQQAAKPPAPRWPLTSASHRGALLSALERSEAGDSGAGPSRLQPGDVIDLRDDGDSPIRSFTPISEATDCFVDFRKAERSKKPSRRRR